MLTILQGDSIERLRELPDESVQCCVTSPPSHDLAYCGGVIDSDGTIGVKRSTYAMRVRGDSSVPVYSERICVKQVSPEAVDLLRSIFGGCRYLAKPQRSCGKELHVWQITDKKAVAACKALLPYLRIKYGQALNCLMLRELKETSRKERMSFGRGHVGGKRRSDKISAAMQVCYLRSKSLNQIGKAGDAGARNPDGRCANET